MMVLNRQENLLVELDEVDEYVVKKREDHSEDEKFNYFLNIGDVSLSIINQYVDSEDKRDVGFETLQ
jgi:hypothetical protein